MNAFRILIVDPNSETREAMRDALTADGHLVTEAETPEKALGLDPAHYDVHLIDVDTEEDDSLNLIQQFRSLNPIAVSIVMTGRVDQAVAVRALESGARSFVHKPVSDADLRLRLSKAIRERQRNVDIQHLLGDLMLDRSDLRHKVAERERFLTHLIDAAPFGIITVDTDGKVVTANRQAEAIYGGGAGKLSGGDPPFDVRADDDVLPRKAVHTRSNGQTFPVLVQHRSVYNDVRRLVADLYVVEDLSEKEQMEDQLLYADRLSLLGQMAPRIAHELKTPLQVVLGCSDLAQVALSQGKTEMLASWLEKIPIGVKQIRQLIDQMTNLGKPQVPVQREMDLQKEIPELVESLAPLGLMKFYDVEIEIDPDTPHLTGDPSEVQQIYRNLIVNAFHAMEVDGEGCLRIVCSSPDGKMIETSISDTGCGIPEDKMDDIFEPFFTTKPEGKGTGLGLPIVKTIVDRYSGTIEVESSPDVGTTFTVILPVEPG